MKLDPILDLAHYGLGQVYGWDSDRRRSFLLRLGLVLTLAFVVIRGLNTYGDPSRWAVTPNTFSGASVSSIR